MKPIQCVLKKGKEKPLLARHPWVFSGAIDRVEEGYKAGDVVKIFSAENRFLGMGYLNPASQIAIRMLSFDDISINERFFEKRIKQAVDLRRNWFAADTNVYRVVHAEGDFLPGLIVDRYGDFLVVQFLTAGMERWRETLMALLCQELSVSGVYERDDGEWRDWEGLEKRKGTIRGDEPPDQIEVQEHGLNFVVDIKGGQKTGFYCDQRDNRKMIGELCKGREVLNCFSYTGAFSVYAARGGASKIDSVETSEPALEIAKLNCQKNHLDPHSFTWIKEDVAHYLRVCDKQYDLVILDPPAFCRNKQQIGKATRGYKDINLFGLKRLKSGGLLLTSSCSSYMTQDLFQRVLFDASRDAGRRIKILLKTTQPADHPVSINHPEGEYLKSVLCQVF